MKNDPYNGEGVLLIYKAYLLRKEQHNRQQLSLKELSFLAPLNEGYKTKELDSNIASGPKILVGLHLSGLILTEANLNKADLAGVNLSGVILNKANLNKANLTLTDLTKADLTKADLTEANLSKAVLKNAELCSAKLTGADLSGADLSRVISKHLPVILEEAKLIGADLSGADLRGAILRKTDLTDANLWGTDLTDADLSGANLTGIIEASISLSKIFKKGEDELFRNYFSPQNILDILNRLDDAQLKQTLFGKDKNVPASKYLENLINDINNPKLMENLYTVDNQPRVVLYELQKVLDCVKSHEERIKSTTSANPQPTGVSAITFHRSPEGR